MEDCVRVSVSGVTGANAAWFVEACDQALRYVCQRP
jgi:hypothetical protein